ncbi:hypothetical protein HAX54_030964 [Datura stramonium]|uniref:Uncharacterized protein n=1 Tax=Datura stramonium TaxID=4076 RepID=A0ABS8V8V5_DATST|nr:hypothetical protein [Datura stramonium]
MKFQTTTRFHDPLQPPMTRAMVVVNQAEDSTVTMNPNHGSSPNNKFYLNSVVQDHDSGSSSARPTARDDLWDF